MTAHSTSSSFLYSVTRAICDMKNQIKQILVNKQTQKCIFEMATKTLSMLLQITTKCSIQLRQNQVMHVIHATNKSKYLTNNVQKNCTAAIILHCTALHCKM